MSNASRCQETAVQFAWLAEFSENVEERQAYRELVRLWSAIAGLAERFDRRHDPYAKARIYALMDEVDLVRSQHSLRTAPPSPITAYP